MNTSATGGYVLPISGPLVGRELNRFFQQLVVGMTGIEGENVRPRWQAEPANVPTFGNVWAAIGISRRETQGFAWERMGCGEHPVYSLSRHEELRLLCSFYDNGVDQYADAAAASLRDGLQLEQNRAALTCAGMGFVSSGDIVPLPALLKTRWLYRADLPLLFRRTLTWTYPIMGLAGARAVIQAEERDGTLREQTILLPED